MATLYENYNPGGTLLLFGGTTYWRCQTFTVQPREAHKLTSVKLRMRRTSGSGGTVTLSLRVIDSTGAPTGADLATATYDADLLGALAWHELTFSTPYTLNAGAQYALVWRVDVANVSLEVDGASATYVGGSAGDDNADSGATWVMGAGYDWAFEEWGVAIDTLAHVSIGGKAAAGLAVARNS